MQLATDIDSTAVTASANTAVGMQLTTGVKDGGCRGKVSTKWLHL